LFGVVIVNKASKGMAFTYLCCSGNEAFYRGFFVETDFVSDYADGY